MSTNVAKPARVAIIGASGTYGKGILARAEEIGVEAVVVTRSPHKFKDVKPTTTVVETQLDEVVAGVLRGRARRYREWSAVQQADETDGRLRRQQLIGRSLCLLLEQITKIRRKKCLNTLLLT